ncbi:MAG: hypothetical protein ACW963_05395, partial [Candidatus Sifarchaeia archaeon]
NKRQSIEESISNLRTENEKVKSKLIAMGYPENMFKRDFDDDEESLNDKIQKHHTTILNLQTSQLKIKKQIKEINLEIAKQQTNEKVLQKEIDHLIMQNNEINKEMGIQSEPMRLAVITSEYQSTHDLLDILTLEIETIHKRIHERG